MTVYNGEIVMKQKRTSQGQYFGPMLPLGNLRQMMESVKDFSDDAEVRISVTEPHPMEPGSRQATTIEVSE